jgi:glycosyltransferase involved in cell wall biosynthesis
MKKVAILTSFSDIQKAYSLNIIVQYQLKSLILNGYEPTLIVHEGFKPEGDYAHPAIKYAYIPNVPAHNEVKKDETFDQDVDGIEAKLLEILKDIDIVITHDVIYQNACLKHNIAARRVAKKLTNIKWLHWIHSATSPLLLSLVRPIFNELYVKTLEEPFPNSFYVYPNNYAVPSVAQNFNIDPANVKVVHHPTDICGYFGFPKDLEEMIYRKGILNVDAICTYPVRLDTGKQVEMVIKTMAMLKEFGLTIRVIIADFHSTGPEKIAYRDQCKQVAIDYGLNSDELTWLSEENEAWKYEVPQEYIRCLQTISNVFIMPSVSETYSLIAQEAALTKQVVVLNGDFPPFRAIYGENAIYRKYSSAYDSMTDPEFALTPNSWTETKYGADNLPEEARKQAERDYHKDTAGRIAARLKHPEIALSIFLRKNRNLEVIFKKELEPLFFDE